ncbi:MAG: YraN family protein [Bacteroidales bacterium]|nr:YraN family protein [Lachnoclostridium sp.]MCM1385408.1 YraN family protein [Lachnoclostridium sp.]MCM1464110.1 YraN family protein [Bacteroidales bacterium]
MNKRRLGFHKEQIAADYLTARGMRIVERNFRGHQGEIDIVGYEGNCLVFVEVKYRSGKTFGSAAAAVDIKKQQQICKVADYYRFLHHVSENAMVRYDVVAIDGEEIQWIPNAFPHIYANRRGYR